MRSSEIATVGVKACDWISSTRIGRGVGRMVVAGSAMSGCRVDAGEVLDDATAGDGGVQGAPVEAGRQVDRFEIDVELHERREDIKDDQAELEAV